MSVQLISKPLLMPLLNLFIFVAMLTGCGGGGSAGTKTPEANGSNVTLSENAVSSSSASSKSSAASSSKKSIASSSQSSSKSNGEVSSVDNTVDSSLNPPNNLVVKSTYYDAVSLAWKPPSDTSGIIVYKIYRDHVEIDTIDAGDTTYIDFDVAPGKSYTYGITAGDGGNNWSTVESVPAQTPAGVFGSSSSSSSSQASSTSPSPISSSSSVATSSAISSSLSNSSASSSLNNSSTSSSLSSSASSADKQAPTKPGNLATTVLTQNKVTLTWTASSDNIGVTAYRIYKNGVSIANINANQNTYSDESLIDNATYIFTVSAGDQAGNWSQPASITILTPELIPTTGTVSFKWLVPNQRENGNYLAPTEIDGYEIRYKLQGQTTFSYMTIHDKSAESFTITNLLGSYYFEIAVFDTNNVYSKFVAINPK